MIEKKAKLIETVKSLGFDALDVEVTREIKVEYRGAPVRIEVVSVIAEWNTRV